MIIDEVKIKIVAGKGGDGLASFRREKFIPKGGPDGGDGGKGGDVYLICQKNLDTLSFFNARKVFIGENGENGKKKKQTGKNGQDLYLSVPEGTLIFEIKKDKTYFIADLVTENQKIKLASGGQGGLGNINFASATNQTPTYAQNGSPGQEKSVKLELRLLAQIGIIGLPNSGKSTLLSKISAAHPKIGDYPFTTTEPNLGAMEYKNKKYIVADIPGLISGAHLGKGLGVKFLRHIQRTKILIHLIAADSNNLEADYNQVRQELALFSQDLTLKKELVVINKIDKNEKIKIPTKMAKLKPIKISALKAEGIDLLKNKIVKLLD